MKFYREWCLLPLARRGTMLPLHIIKSMLKSSNPGYASVYMFDEDAAKVILLDRSSAGLSRFPVYTDELVIDLDSGDEQLKRAEKVLRERLLYYTVWKSGGKGYHIYIPLTRLVSGKEVPYSQRKYVEGMNIGADLSLYQHGRIISLPGRVHPKTGAKKALVYKWSGNKLELPLLVAPEPTFNFGANGGLEDLEAGLWKVLCLLADAPNVGNRHTQLWSTARHFADAGISYETTLELIGEVNERWPNPKTAEEVTAAVQQAYKK